MNETPLHEPLIAEEGKEKERVFTGTPERLVNICLASISALIIYWTVYVSADVMWKHGLYIMTVFCMTLSRLQFVAEIMRTFIGISRLPPIRRTLCLFRRMKSSVRS